MDFMGSPDLDQERRQQRMGKLLYVFDDFRCRKEK